MTRREILHLQRKEVLLNLADKKEKRARLLTELMDIDDELEELERTLKINELKVGGPNYDD